ncbi:hypothetical protein B0H11DRAFT_1989424 [Mycena galericulata]|nr:hypothetical protein B0H11DRAFT_1989424 [Mycena galericulata]
MADMIAIGSLAMTLSRRDKALAEVRNILKDTKRLCNEANCRAVAAGNAPLREDLFKWIDFFQRLENFMLHAESIDIPQRREILSLAVRMRNAYTAIHHDDLRDLINPTPHNQHRAEEQLAASATPEAALFSSAAPVQDPRSEVQRPTAVPETVLPLSKEPGEPHQSESSIADARQRLAATVAAFESLAQASTARDSTRSELASNSALPSYEHLATATTVPRPRAPVPAPPIYSEFAVIDVEVGPMEWDSDTAGQMRALFDLMPVPYTGNRHITAGASDARGYVLVQFPSANDALEFQNNWNRQPAEGYESVMLKLAVPAVTDITEV